MYSCFVLSFVLGTTNRPETTENSEKLSSRENELMLGSVKDPKNCEELNVISKEKSQQTGRSTQEVTSPGLATVPIDGHSAKFTVVHVDVCGNKRRRSLQPSGKSDSSLVC